MLGFIKHLLVPHSGNNHRAKILHNSSVFFLILALFVFSFLGNFVSRAYPEILGISYSVSEQELLILVNQERQNHGLAPLSSNPLLDDAARRKAADMLEKDYWAHFSPDGSTSPWGFIRAAGYSYKYAGENLAKGFTDSPSVVSAWMGSQTHRDNILSNKFNEVGFAIVPGNLQGEETVLIVEMFGNTGLERVAAEETPVAVAVSEPGPESTPQSQVVPEEDDIAGEELVQLDSEVPPSGSVSAKPKIDAGIATKAVSTAGLTFLAFGFVLDAVIVERKRIPRVVGHNLDHIILIVMFIVFVIILRGGVVL